MRFTQKKIDCLCLLYLENLDIRTVRESESTALVHLSVDMGISVKLAYPVTTLLEGAVFRGNVSMVKLLLQEGSDPSVSLNYPINFAVLRGYTLIIDLLLTAGVNVNSGHCYSPFDRAVERGSLRVVNMLLSAGGKVTLDTIKYAMGSSIESHAKVKLLSPLINK